MMPAIKLNNLLARFIPVASSTGTPSIRRALVQPYLTYDAPRVDRPITAQDSRSAILKDVDGLLRTPFPMFRFCCEQEGGVQILGFVERHAGRLNVLTFFSTKNGLSDNFDAVSLTPSKRDPGGIEYDGRIYESDSLRDISEELKVLSSQRGTGLRGNLDDLGPSGYPLKLYHQHCAFETEVPTAREQFFLSYNIITYICYEYIAPHNFIARVTPDKEGKSIQWKQAREHLTLIHRHHPANSDSVAMGDVVNPDAKQLSRIAHCRRAHSRLLTSTRFKYKLGQRIAVRSTWVGPKEWKDTAGQTYQILTPVV